MTQILAPCGDADAAAGGEARPFWERKRLAEMTPQEWESLCDGCARCCLIKLEDVDSGEIATTNLACRLLDQQTCRCKDYANRTNRVPTCIRLTPGNIADIAWMPASCAYRRLAEGRRLASWHPLISGDPETVHRAGISVRGKTISEEEVAPEDMDDHIVAWDNSKNELKT